MSVEPVFFHVDLDAFFASVEQLDTPAYRGKPVIVGGMGRRGVVSTCSYEARSYGVHSAMPTAKARSLCPEGIFIQTRMHRYHEKSREIMRLFTNFTPDVQQLSVDEAFLDMSGMNRLFSSPRDAALQLKERISTMTGLTVSVGIASNKYIAKIASGLSKPDGLLLVPYGSEAAFMQGLTLKQIWGIGAKSRGKLAAAGFSTIADVLAADKAALQRILGTAGGSFLYNAVRGNTDHLFNEQRKSKTISTERTFEYDLCTKEALSNVLFELCAELMFRIIDEKIKSCTVYIKIRYSDFTTVSAQQHTDTLINDSADLYDRAESLFFSRFDSSRAVRLIGVGVADNSAAGQSSQLDLFSSETTAKKRKLEETLHQIAQTNKNITITQARLL